MDDTRFDRRVQMLGGGASRRGVLGTLAVMAGLGASVTSDYDGVAAKRKKRKKRCKPLGAACSPNSGRKCCNNRACDEVLGRPGFFCCKDPLSSCQDDGECCGNHVCDQLGNGAGKVCCVDQGFPCDTADDCCGDLVCDTADGVQGKICCPGVGSPCEDDGDCCGDQTYCDEGTCALCPFVCPAGERCVHGTCTCDPFDNSCPDEVDGQCTCGAIVRLDPNEFIAACVDRNSACDLDKPCDTNEDCPSGSVCLLGCADPPAPNPRRCSTPCVPA